MIITRTQAHARVGLLGNPSDGYFGKTLSTVVPNFSARAVIYEWPELEIMLSREDRCEFGRLDDLVEDVKLNGLYGGLRLIKGTIKRFAEYCSVNNIAVADRNFSLRYETDIPRQVGLAGSSAIITAVFRGLMKYYKVDISPEVLPSLVLAVETEEIGIQAGLQDRVCQVYDGLVFMDFDRQLMETQGVGKYELLDPSLLPPLYVAYRSDLSAISGVYHSDLKARWDQGDEQVVGAMNRFAELAEAGRECLLRGDHTEFSRLMDQNFDLRAEISELDPINVAMVKIARKIGVSAKYAGSGGAIVGICDDDQMFKKLANEFEKIGCTVIRPS